MGFLDRLFGRRPAEPIAEQDRFSAEPQPLTDEQALVIPSRGYVSLGLDTPISLYAA
jgi:hypothetical protein